MINKIATLGSAGLRFLQNVGVFGIFLGDVLVFKPNFRKLVPAIIKQLYMLGVLSSIIIIISGLFVGMVLGLQGHHTLAKFGANSQLGQLIALSVCRELGPVMSALLFAGRAGTALTAEIGLMKATEQLSSMEMMGVNPLHKIIYPRFLAGLIALPLLSFIFAALAIYGGYLVGVQWLSVDPGIFWSNMQSAVNFRLDILSGILKSIVFAIIVTIIAVFQGWSAMPTAEGISLATMRTVVHSSLAILAADFMLTAIMIGDW